MPALLLRLLGFALALFPAYVVGRALGILLGIGPYLTEAIAVTAVVVAFGVRSRA